MKKTIFFYDLDGTIIDSSVGITRAVQYSLNKFGIQVDDVKSLYKFIGPPLWSSFMDFYGFSKDKADLGVEYFREYYSEKGILENTLYEGIGEMLKYQRESGIRIALTTSKPMLYANKIMEYFELDQYFELIGGSELNGDRSEKDMVIQYALDEMKITQNDEIVMIGDRKFDIIGSKKFGIDSIGVLYGYGSENELNSAGANYIVNSVLELDMKLRELGKI
ncbi:MAG: HAD-IA family hydrolase [Tissierellia bacterium]|nr:HAD-IA family hydrolase [Tissierellia bacterium]